MTTVNNDLEVGSRVEINPKSDRTRKVIINGVVKSILTKSKSHPHGILVELKSGEIGRVKKILGSDSVTTSDSPAHDYGATATSEETPRSTPNLTTKIGDGENHYVEFKKSALWSSKLTKEDINNYKPPSSELHTYGQATSKIIIAKTLAAFLNTDGGTLVIGIKENKDTNEDEIVGVEPDFHFLKDPTTDGYRRMLVDIVRLYYPPNIHNHFGDYIKIDFHEIEGKLVCSLEAAKSDVSVFTKLKNEDHFFIRVDASTRELKGAEIVDYCTKRFQK